MHEKTIIDGSLRAKRRTVEGGIASRAITSSSPTARISRTIVIATRQRNARKIESALRPRVLPNSGSKDTATRDL